MLGHGQKAEDGVVARTVLGMRETRDHREVIPEILDRIEILRELVVLAGLLGEKRRRMNAQRHADADHAADGLGGRGRGATAREEAIEHRQRESDAGGAEEVATGDWGHGR